jgi:protoporphyrinogen oxidase
MEQRKRIGVIGGGFAGLTAAYRLAHQGFEVTLWERNQYGGQAGTFPVGDTQLEIFYHHLFKSDTSIAGLAEELGIGDRLVWLPSNVGYFTDGKIYPLNGAKDVLKLGSIPFHDRIRLGAVTFYLQHVTDWKKYEKITAHDWLQRALGKRAYDKTLGAQLRAKFGRYYDEVAMVWFWGKIWLRTTSRRNPLDQEKLGYFTGSFRTMVDALVDGCERVGVTMRVGDPITSLEQVRDDKGWSVGTESIDQPEPFDAIIATVPSPVFQTMVPNLPQTYADQLGRLNYEAAVVAILELDRPLTDIYWLNIADDDMPFTGIIEHTNFVDSSVYGGRRFVYLSKYLEPDHPYFTMDDDRLIDEYVPHLKKVNLDFDQSWIRNTWVFRERAAQPIIPLNYSEMIPSHRTPLHGLYLANTTQIYPEDRGTNYSVRLGNDIAKLVQEDLTISDRSRPGDVSSRLAD